MWYTGNFSLTLSIVVLKYFQIHFENAWVKVYMDYSWIQDFEADFPEKVSLKIPNLAGSTSFFQIDLFSVYLNTIDHLNLKLLIFIGILQVLDMVFKSWGFLKFWTFTHENVKQIN